MSDEVVITTDSGNEVKPGIKAKTLSLISKVIAGVIIIGGHILKWCGILAGASSSEICVCGFAVMAVFGTVDLNIALDKFTKK